MLKKRLASITLIALFLMLALAPDASAHQRCRTRSRNVAARSYYAPRPYYRNTRSYYAPRYSRDRRRNNGRTNAFLTIAAPAAIGAGVGAIVGGGKGAGVGALLGGGGGAAYYLIKNRRNRRR